MAEAGDDCELIHCSRNAVVIDRRVYGGLRGEPN